MKGEEKQKGLIIKKRCRNINIENNHSKHDVETQQFLKHDYGKYQPNKSKDDKFPLVSFSSNSTQAQQNHHICLVKNKHNMQTKEQHAKHNSCKRKSSSIERIQQEYITATEVIQK